MMKLTTISNIFSVLLLLDEAYLVAVVTFNRKYTGVVFKPYPKATDEKAIPAEISYTAENVRSMLEVVSSKFTRILLNSVDAIYAPYNGRVIYDHYTAAAGKTAEMAARINQERKNLSLTVLIGFLDFGLSDIRIHNVQVEAAIQSCEIANSIYPGTVEGIFSSSYNMLSLEWANRTLHRLKFLRNESRLLSLPIGSKQFCDQESLFQQYHPDSVLLQLLNKEIILKSDFVICDYPVSQVRIWQGAKHIFQSFKSTVYQTQILIKSINSQIDIMWSTFWPKREINETGYDISNFLIYWTSIDKLATENNLPVFLDGTIENIVNNHFMIGWWKLKHLNDINNVSGYTETISAVRNNPKIDEENKVTFCSFKNTNNWRTISLYGYIGIGTIGTLYLIFIVCIGGAKCKLFRRYVLTRNEVNEFREGILCTNDCQSRTHKSEDFNVAALKCKYDVGLEISKNDLELDGRQIISKGDVWDVFAAKIRNSAGDQEDVALKTTKPNNGPMALKELLSEIKILNYLGNHPNILQIIRAYTREVRIGIVYLLTEPYTIVNLKNHLKSCGASTGNADKSPVPLYDMVRWTHDIACGMEYLSQKGIIHSNLACRNIVVSSDGVAKICNIGFSSILYDYVKTKKRHDQLPWRWMAIESLKTAEFSTKSDVWSFGVTLWEIFSMGSQPYSGLIWCPEFVETLGYGFRLEQPHLATAEIYACMSNCWASKRSARPSFSDLKISTSQFKNNNTIANTVALD